MDRELARRGIDAEGFRSTQLDGSSIDDADLILCAEGWHVVEILDRYHFGAPSGSAPLHLPGRTFTMLGFATGAQRPGLGDLADPTGGTRRGYRRCVDALQPIAEAVLLWAAPGVV
jgi:protein-tyrosine-phosphatase